MKCLFAILSFISVSTQSCFFLIQPLSPPYLVHLPVSLSSHLSFLHLKSFQPCVPSLSHLCLTSFSCLPNHFLLHLIFPSLPLHCFFLSVLCSPSLLSFSPFLLDTTHNEQQKRHTNTGQGRNSKKKEITAMYVLLETEGDYVKG